MRREQHTSVASSACAERAFRAAHQCCVLRVCCQSIFNVFSVLDLAVELSFFCVCLESVSHTFVCMLVFPFPAVLANKSPCRFSLSLPPSLPSLFVCFTQQVLAPAPGLDVLSMCNCPPQYVHLPLRGVITADTPV